MARGQALPLDASEVWETKEAAQLYANGITDGTSVAYVGQTLKIIENNSVSAYIIADTTGKLMKLANEDNTTTLVNEIIDDTLTIEGKAAEAKVTGDWLKMLESRIFIGTRAEYNAANEQKLVPLNALVILIDELENEATSGATTAKLGVAILGSMLLGQQ